jgi:outer membrane protein assembly factor BamB
MKYAVSAVLAAALIVSACSMPPRPVPTVTVSEDWAGLRMGGIDNSKSSRTAFASPEKWKAHRINLLSEVERDFPSGEHSTPLVLGEALIVASSVREVFAMTWEGEELIWKVSTKGRVFASPAYDESRIFVADDEGVLLALDLEGNELWRFENKYPFLVSPIAEDGHVYALNAKQDLVCLDAASGEARWGYGSEIAAEGTIWRGASLALGDGNVFVGLADGRVVALDAKVGALQWKTKISEKAEFADVLVGPAYEEGAVYAGSRQGLSALNPLDGSVIWFKPYAAVGGLAIGEARLYFGTADGGMAAVDKTNGALVWTTALDGGVAAAPVLAGGEVIVGATRGGLTALDAESGKILKNYRPGSGISARPWVGEKGVAFISNAGVLHRFKR